MTTWVCGVGEGWNQRLLARHATDHMAVMPIVRGQMSGGDARDGVGREL